MRKQMTDEKRGLARRILEEAGQVILGKEELIFRVLTAMLAGGHILLEDVPGVGKTTLAVAFSRIMGLSWRRVQFTPDVMPSDLTGFSIYRKDQEAFVYQPGAVFCNLLLADEINRTSPRTQSALLEVMEERQVTVDGVTRPVPSPFYVIATQNPYGTAGTHPLPPAQSDRFMVSLSMGYPDFEDEVELARDTARRDKRGQVLCDARILEEMSREAEGIFIHDKVCRYMFSLVAATRNHSLISQGASPRATIALAKMSRAMAWLQREDYVTPLEVRELFIDVCRHRIVPNRRAQSQGMGREEILKEILEHVR